VLCFASHFSDVDSSLLLKTKNSTIFYETTSVR
jgi:hypothetical protein